VEARGPTNVWAAFDYDACCLLYSDRSAGYMVPIESSPDDDLPCFGFALRLLAVCERCSRARCTYGGTLRGDKCDVYEWNIGLKTAKRTLQVTMQQHGVRTAVHPLHRRQYCVDHLHLNRRCLDGDWFTDTSFSKV
jgi:hypothetical protein